MAAEEAPKPPQSILCPVTDEICYQIDGDGQPLSEPKCQVGPSLCMLPLYEEGREEEPIGAAVWQRCGDQLTPLERSMLRVAIETGITAVRFLPLEAMGDFPHHPLRPPE